MDLSTISFKQITKKLTVKICVWVYIYIYIYIYAALSTTEHKYICGWEEIATQSLQNNCRNFIIFKGYLKVQVESIQTRGLKKIFLLTVNSNNE